MDFLQKTRLIWQKVSLVQRALLAGVLVALAIIGSLLVHWARKPDMQTLFQELPPAEASRITEKLNEQKIPYELRDGGTTVCVPKDQVYQLRLDLAKEGLPMGEQSGYKLFDEEKIGISPFVQNVNLKRALQDELAKSIQMVDGVAHARVHIVSPEQKLFTSEQEQTTASVVLRLQPGYRLSPANIAAITHMVSGSVKGLRAENVTIIDSQGRLLSDSTDPTLATGAGTVHDYKERVEQSLARKAEEMLTAVLGPGRAIVQVSAVVDMNSINTITETYDPKSKVPTKEEITTNSESGAGGTGAKTAAGTTRKDETIVTEYQVGKVVKQQTVLPGEIQSLSVAAFVDLSPADPNQAGSGGQAGPVMSVADVEEMIRNALGLKPADALKVVDARFQKPALPQEEEASHWPRYVALAQHMSLGLVGLCALAVFRIFTRARVKVAAERQAQLPGGEGFGGLLPAGDSSDPAVVRQHIARALKKNPDQVRQMFLSWIEEKE